MKNGIKISVLSLGFLPLIIFSKNIENSTIGTTHTTGTLATYHTLPGNIEEKYNDLVENKLKKIGFTLVNPHKRVNYMYETKWGSTALDVLSFMPIVNDKSILPLLNIDPRIAGFSPFNLVIHKKKNENVTHVGHLVPEAMLDILGIQDTEIRDKFTAPFTALDQTINQVLGEDTSTLSYTKLPKNTMIQYAYTFERPEDLDDFIDEFQNTFSLAFMKKEYLIAGFHDFMETSDDAEEILNNYDLFWTYLLCHLEFSYNMFDNDNARPEAGLYAPCTMYMYVKKNTNTLILGMNRLHTWADTLAIKDPKKIKLIDALDHEIPSILESLGMKAIPQGNPLLQKEIPFVKKDTNISHTPSTHTQIIQVGDHTIDIEIPQAPKVIQVEANKNKPTSSLSGRSITFSKRVPPGYTPHSFDTQKVNTKETEVSTNVGEVSHGKIAAYLRGALIDLSTATKKLKNAGFEVLTSTPINKKEDLISVIFTHPLLKTLANKKNRGFIASLRLLVDTKEKTISITNPIYMAKGFLQDAFDEKISKEILDLLLSEFTGLHNAKDTLKYQLLTKYQFMKGMPYYQDMVEVASGNNLLEKVQNNTNVVFQQTLENGSTLIGIKLGKRTSKFIKRIGRNNAAILPYPILIEDGKAKILDPKYYISFMYPLLTMSEFMTIATVPDAMIKDCEKIFK